MRHVRTFAGKVLHNPNKKLWLNVMLYNLTTVQLLRVAQSPDSLLQRSKTQLPLLPICPRSACGGYVWVSMSKFMFDSSTITTCHSMDGFQ